MTPFSTTAIREHLLTHISQVVAISSRLAVGASFFENGFRRGTDAATVVPTALSAAQVRNRLRFIELTISREQICSVLNCSARFTCCRSPVAKSWKYEYSGKPPHHAVGLRSYVWSRPRGYERAFRWRNSSSIEFAFCLKE